MGSIAKIHAYVEVLETGRNFYVFQYAISDGYGVHNEQ